MSTTEIEQVATPPLPAITDERSVEDLVEHVRKIEAAMQQAMKDGEHYGVIPGTQKPTLLKPGAEMLMVLFRLGADPESKQDWVGNHLTVTTKTTLRHIPTGNWIGAGSGMCSTMEKRYAERQQNRTCPACGSEAIIKGKQEYGGGWVCFKKKGGCGSKFRDDDPVITEQEVGMIENPDLPDVYNTVLKMAEKRALVSAVLNATAASQVFTQDTEDAAPPTPPPAAERTDRMTSDDEKNALCELYVRKSGQSIEEAAAWLMGMGAKADSYEWLSNTQTAMEARPDFVSEKNNENGEGTDPPSSVDVPDPPAIVTEPELPVDEDTEILTPDSVEQPDEDYPF